MKKTVIMIDPPSGWKYGFPKPYPASIGDQEEVNEWLVKNGYPQREIDSLGEYMHVRYWEQEIDV